MSDKWLKASVSDLRTKQGSIPNAGKVVKTVGMKKGVTTLSEHKNKKHSQHVEKALNRVKLF